MFSVKNANKCKIRMEIHALDFRSVQSDFTSDSFSLSLSLFISGTWVDGNVYRIFRYLPMRKSIFFLFSLGCNHFYVVEKKWENFSVRKKIRCPWIIIMHMAFCEQKRRRINCVCLSGELKVPKADRPMSYHRYESCSNENLFSFKIQSILCVCVLFKWQNLSLRFRC